MIAREAAACGRMALKPMSASLAGYKATLDKSKLSGCEHEDGSGWCTITELNACKHAIPLDNGDIACDEAL
jgi:hypothetical protein